MSKKIIAVCVSNFSERGMIVAGIEPSPVSIRHDASFVTIPDENNNFAPSVVLNATSYNDEPFVVGREYTITIAEKQSDPKEPKLPNM